MSDDRGIIGRLTATLAGFMQPTPVVGHPVDTVPAVPSAVLYPGDPFMEPADWCDNVINVEIVVYLARLNVDDALDLTIDSVAPVRFAAAAEGWQWQTTRLTTTDVNGITYLQAIHELQYASNQ